MSRSKGRGWVGCFLDVRVIGRGTSSTDHPINVLFAHRGSVWWGGYPRCGTMGNAW